MPSPPQKTRVTQLDVARVAGVNRATVSLALHGHPGLPATTKERILKICEQMGYVPDPMLSVLAAYRHGRRTTEFRGTLGWLAQTVGPFRWRELSHFAAYFKAARQRAETHGYQIEVLDLQEMGVSWARAAGIAKSRGIDGVLLCPQPYPDMNLMAFPWQDFAAVTFGYSIVEPKLHSVASAQYRAAFATTKEVLARGYKRVGLSMEAGHDQRTDHNYLAGYLAAWELYGKGRHVPVCAEWQSRSWFERHRPDVILTPVYSGWEKVLETLGVKVPDEVGIACPSLASSDETVSGMREDNEQIGAAAVDFLVSALHRGERGIPAHPQRVLVEGTWVEGKTLRPRPEP
ncbi:LacI family DNA-binding transcriptional regulator [Geminisphaera colitermitum]|uniref:LacI family DNA-binding transcriptional regulator n=1 Tax=Geminisphaera colitermitum TaxID=1148786 RepID=UPI000158CC9C|nr:LacI family DNA-binding transcriptional regulator [Geminisphaera colitermitum]